MANKTLIANLGTRLDTVNSVHFSSKSDQTIRKGSSRPSPCRFCRSTSLRRWMTWSTCRWEPEKKEEIHWIYLVVNMEQKCSATFWVSKISIESSTERIYKGMPPWLLWNVPHFSDSVRQLCVNEGCWDTEVVSHGLARRKPKKKRTMLKAGWKMCFCVRGMFGRWHVSLWCFFGCVSNSIELMWILDWTTSKLWNEPRARKSVQVRNLSNKTSN